MTTPIVVYFEKNAEVVLVSLPLLAGALKTHAFKELVPPSKGRVVSEYMLVTPGDGRPVDAFSNVDEKQHYALELKVAGVPPPPLATNTLLASPSAVVVGKDANPIDLSSVNASLVAEVTRLRKRLHASESTSRTHVELYNKHESLMKCDYARVIPPQVTRKLSKVRTRQLWNAIPPAFAHTADKNESEHQALFDKLMPWLLKQLDSVEVTPYQYHRKPQLGKVPDWALLDKRDTSVSWRTTVVLCELEAWTGNSADGDHHKEGVGQLLGYLGRKADHTDQAEIVGVFSNTWKIEIIRRVVSGDGLTQTLYTTGLMDFLVPRAGVPASATTDPSPGFEALVSLLLCTPEQLGRPSPIPSRVNLANGGYLDLDKRIGRGGSSDVMQATLGDQQVAVKVLHSTDPIKDHETEATVLRTLQRSKACDAIPAVHPLTLASDCLIMTPIGKPLTSVIAEYKTGVLPADKVMHIIQGLCRALRHAHDHHIVHMDVRKENVIVVGADMHPVLVDWALALEFGSKKSGLYGTLACAADIILQSEMDDRDWFATPDFDWQSLQFLYLTLISDELSKLVLTSSADDHLDDFIRLRQELLLEHADDAAVKFIDEMKASETAPEAS